MDIQQTKDTNMFNNVLLCEHFQSKFQQIGDMDMFSNALLSEPLNGHPFDPNIGLIRPNNQNYAKPEYVAVFPWLFLHTYNKTYLKYALFTGNLFGIPREMGAVQI